MSHKVRAVVGPALSITAIVAVLLAIDDRLLNRSTRVIEDVFISSGQVDGLLLAFLGAGVLLVLLMLRN